MSLSSGVTCLLKVLLAFSFCVTCVCSQSSRSRGLKIGITEEAFNRFIDEVVMDEVFAAENQIQLPDEADSAETPLGTVYYNITDILVTGFVKPVYHVAITAGRLNLTLWNTSFTVNGNWNYDYRRLNFTDSGYVNVSVVVHSLNVSVVSDLDPLTARPSLAVDRCSNVVGQALMDLGGGDSWFNYLFFGGALLESVGRKAQAAICGFVESVFRAETGALAALHPLQRDIGGDGLAIDLRPVEAPKFGDGYVEFLLDGTVYDKDDPKKFPMQVGPFPEFTESSKRDPVSVLVSEYVLSSFAHAFYGRRKSSQQQQQQGITRSSLPPSMESFLSTTCSGGGGSGTACLGKVSPQIAAQFPNADLEIPEIVIYPGPVIISMSGIEMTADVGVGVRARLPDDSLVPVFDARLKFTASGSVSFDNGSRERRRLRVDVTQLETDVALVANSTVGEIATEALSDAFDALTELYLMPKLKAATKDGFEVPLSESIQLKNPVLSVIDHALLFTTDIEGSSP